MRIITSTKHIIVTYDAEELNRFDNHDIDSSCIKDGVLEIRYTDEDGNRVVHMIKNWCDSLTWTTQEEAE